MVTHHEQTVFREYEQQGTELKPKQRESGYRQVDEAGGWARASRGGRSSLGNYSDYKMATAGGEKERGELYRGRKGVHRLSAGMGSKGSGLGGGHHVSSPTHAQNYVL